MVHFFFRSALLLALTLMHYPADASMIEPDVQVFNDAVSTNQHSLGTVLRSIYRDRTHDAIASSTNYRVRNQHLRWYSSYDPNRIGTPYTVVFSSTLEYHRLNGVSITSSNGQNICIVRTPSNDWVSDIHRTIAAWRHELSHGLFDSMRDGAMIGHPSASSSYILQPDEAEIRLMELSRMHFAHTKTFLMTRNDALTLLVQNGLMLSKSDLNQMDSKIPSKLTPVPDTIKTRFPEVATLIEMFPPESSLVGIEAKRRRIQLLDLYCRMAPGLR